MKIYFPSIKECEIIFFCDNSFLHILIFIVHILSAETPCDVVVCISKQFYGNEKHKM